MRKDGRGVQVGEPTGPVGRCPGLGDPCVGLVVDIAQSGLFHGLARECFPALRKLARAGPDRDADPHAKREHVRELGPLTVVECEGHVRVERAAGGPVPGFGGPCTLSRGLERGSRIRSPGHQSFDRRQRPSGRREFHRQHGDAGVATQQGVQARGHGEAVLLHYRDVLGHAGHSDLGLEHVRLQPAAYCVQGRRHV